jgi:DNA-binding response OmpR family regulator
MPPSLLVVNDETNFILLLERILSRDGYQVTAVHGSEEALYQLGRKSFDLAILDIKMYPMNGVELLAEIKKRSPSTQVIMVSGNLTDDIREQCIKMGATDCLTKPLKISELKAVVRQHAHAHERIQYGEKLKGKPLKRV